MTASGAWRGPGSLTSTGPSGASTKVRSRPLRANQHDLKQGVDLERIAASQDASAGFSVFKLQDFHAPRSRALFAKLAWNCEGALPERVP